MERALLQYVVTFKKGFQILIYQPGFWMSDKPLVQQALATELAELILTITTTSASLAFLRGFWETTVREWNGIDRLRFAVILPFDIL